MYEYQDFFFLGLPFAHKLDRVDGLLSLFHTVLMDAGSLLTIPGIAWLLCFA